MAQVRKILIADPDIDSVRTLTRALRARGYQVHYAPDGSRALEICVLRHPDLVLFDEACKLLDARTFIQILRTNPRTEEVPVVLTTTNLDVDRLRGLRLAAHLKKPFNLDEVLSRLEHIFRRNEAAKDLKSDAQEIEGSLSQLGIPDLLQILGMNKRSGKLSLERGNERGEILVTDGRAVNARLGRVEAEKALFRLLSWTEGTFTFAPGTNPGKARIDRAMDDALLEGMRQADEVNRLMPSLPSRTTRLVLAPDADLSQEQHPVTAQVVDLLRQPRAMGEVLDLAPAPDLEVLSVLITLMQKGVARVAEGEEEGSGPLLGPAELHALRSRVLRGKSPLKVVTAKVFICGNGPSAARRLFAQLPGVAAVAAEPTAIKSGFGTLGRLDLSEVLHLDFCVLPPAEAARPLWRPFSAGAVGALLMDSSEAAVRLASYLAWEIRVPIAVLGSTVPEKLLGAPAGAIALGDDLTEALRGLLIQSLHPAPAAPGAQQEQRAASSA